jgi:lysophospholipase L1-like esterase
MKSKFLLLALTAGLLFSFAPERKIVVYTIGDSTMANKPLDNMSLERGWGQVLSAYLDSRYVEVDNHARNGRSSLSFRNEGLWAPIYDKIKPGDYVLIQFGHNDEKPSPDRHTEPGSTFNEQLRRYVLETREKGGVPVLLTPIVRRKFDEEGRLIPTHGDYPQAVRDVAAELDVILIDHNVLSRRLVQDLGPEASKELFMWVPPGTNPALPQGKEDDTHLRALGGAGHPSNPIGPNGSPILPGHSVMIDMAGNFTGYLDDLSRCYSYGKLPEKAYKAHQVALELQDRLQERLKEGEICEDLYYFSIDFVALSDVRAEQLVLGSQPGNVFRKTGFRHRFDWFGFLS